MAADAGDALEATLSGSRLSAISASPTSLDFRLGCGSRSLPLPLPEEFNREIVRHVASPSLRPTEAKRPGDSLLVTPTFKTPPGSVPIASSAAYNANYDHAAAESASAAVTIARPAAALVSRPSDQTTSSAVTAPFVPSVAVLMAPSELPPRILPSSSTKYASQEAHAGGDMSLYGNLLQRLMAMSPAFRSLPPSARGNLKAVAGVLAGDLAALAGTTFVPETVSAASAVAVPAVEAPPSPPLPQAPPLPPPPPPSSPQFGPHDGSFYASFAAAAFARYDNFNSQDRNSAAAATASGAVTPMDINGENTSGANLYPSSASDLATSDLLTTAPRAHQPSAAVATAPVAVIAAPDPPPPPPPPPAEAPAPTPPAVAELHRRVEELTSLVGSLAAALERVQIRQSPQQLPSLTPPPEQQPQPPPQPPPQFQQPLQAKTAPPPPTSPPLVQARNAPAVASPVTQSRHGPPAAAAAAAPAAHTARARTTPAAGAVLKLGLDLMLPVPQLMTTASPPVSPQWGEAARSQSPHCGRSMSPAPAPRFAFGRRVDPTGPHTHSRLAQGATASAAAARAPHHAHRYPSTPPTRPKSQPEPSKSRHPAHHLPPDAPGGAFECDDLDSDLRNLLPSPPARLSHLRSKNNSRTDAARLPQPVNLGLTQPHPPPAMLRNARSSCPGPISELAAAEAMAGEAGAYSGAAGGRGCPGGGVSRGGLSSLRRSAVLPGEVVAGRLVIFGDDPVFTEARRLYDMSWREALGESHSNRWIRRVLGHDELIAANIGPNWLTSAAATAAIANGTSPSPADGGTGAYGSWCAPWRNARCQEQLVDVAVAALSGFFATHGAPLGLVKVGPSTYGLDSRRLKLKVLPDGRLAVRSGSGWEELTLALAKVPLPRSRLTGADMTGRALTLGPGVGAAAPVARTLKWT